VIAATNKDLAEEVKKGRFRDDLYYRLNVIEIRIPPLRERREDVPLLTTHFVEKLAHELGKEVNAISEDALKLLMDHDWPGNVRELENAMERAFIMAEGDIGPECFPFVSSATPAVAGDAVDVRVGETLESAERKLTLATLDRYTEKRRAAEVLGISLKTLYNRLKGYGA
jgi:two-component system response regulator AtoC